MKRIWLTLTFYLCVLFLIISPHIASAFTHSLPAPHALPWVDSDHESNCSSCEVYTYDKAFWFQMLSRTYLCYVRDSFSMPEWHNVGGYIETYHGDPVGHGMWCGSDQGGYWGFGLSGATYPEITADTPWVDTTDDMYYVDPSATFNGGYGKINPGYVEQYSVIFPANITPPPPPGPSTCTPYNALTNPTPVLPCSYDGYNYDSLAVEVGAYTNSFYYRGDNYILIDNGWWWKLETQVGETCDGLIMMGQNYSIFCAGSLSFNKNGALFFGPGASYGNHGTLGVSPLSHDFGSVGTSDDGTSCSAPQEFTITNTGGGALSVFDITHSDTTNYVLEGSGYLFNDCLANAPLATILPAGGSCVFKVTFCPQTAGIHDDLFVISSNDPDAQTKSLNVTGFAIEKTSTGFWYPIGTSQFDSACGTWLARDPKHGGCYFKGEYHIGVDMMTAVGAPVYPIANGSIVSVSKNGWGTNNVALIVRHTLADGRVFHALYGHVRTTVRSGPVVGGVPFGTVGPWPYGNHLHFGIIEPGNAPRAPYGKMPNSRWPDTNGFVDPIEFLTTNSPQ